MEYLIIAGIVAIGVFSFVLFVGAPFLPTLHGRVDDGLDLLNLKKGQTMLELGSGDGRMLIAAAKRGIHAVGYELNPVLAAYSYIRAFRYRKYVTVVWGNYWQKQWPESDGMYVFLLKPFMQKLDKRVVRYSAEKPYRVVSFAFEIPERKPKTERNGMFLYEYN